jgi:UDP-glucose 4-epimerase
MSWRVVVLGGNGFLGSQVTRWLAARGHRLRVMDLRLPRPGTALPDVEYREGNFLNASDVEAALESGADLVLHFISTTVPASSIDNVPVEIDTNVAATVRLLDAMTRRGIKRIGFPSSGGTIYGASSAPHREDEVARPTCPYGLGKLIIEDLLRFYRDHRGIDFQIWRVANPYGDATRVHLAQGVIDAFLQRVRTGQPITVWGDGSAVRDFIFADDVAAAIGQLIEGQTWGEVVNVGTGKGASIAEVLRIIENVAGPFQREQVRAYSGPAYAVLDTTRLHQLTGWTPGWTLESGIREAWRRLTAG